MTSPEGAAPTVPNVPLVAVLDYGMGNLRSVEKALERAGARAVVTSDAAEAMSADGLLLPGVGAFPRAMKFIGERGFDDLVVQFAESRRPVLGICLGMQLLFETSTEQGGAAGLGLIPGSVTALEAPGLRLPHIGWELVDLQVDESPLLADTETGEAFYFNHSFAVRPTEPGDVLATATWGEQFACIVGRRNVFGAQFHPEKSGPAGLAFLSCFVALAGRLQQ